MTTKSTITGVVATEPVQKMTKGDEFRAPEPVCCFGLYEMIAGPDQRLKDTGRLINIACYSPEDTSVRTGDIVNINAGPIYSRTWETNGKSRTRYMANTRRQGVTLVRRKQLQPLLL